MQTYLLRKDGRSRKPRRIQIAKCLYFDYVSRKRRAFNTMKPLTFLFPLLSSALLLLPGHSYAYDHDRNQIQQRIAPYGTVSIEGEADAVKQPIPVQPVDEKKQVLTGEGIYQQYCAVCHKSGLAGAPITRNQKQWASRLAKMSVEDLTTSAYKGKNAMPAKGTCTPCSMEDIRKAVEYMLPQND
jgi:cytochrome c5